MGGGILQLCLLLLAVAAVNEPLRFPENGAALEGSEEALRRMEEWEARLRLQQRDFEELLPRADAEEAAARQSGTPWQTYALLGSAVPALLLLLLLLLLLWQRRRGAAAERATAATAPCPHRVPSRLRHKRHGKGAE